MPRLHATLFSWIDLMSSLFFLIDAGGRKHHQGRRAGTLPRTYYCFFNISGVSVDLYIKKSKFMPDVYWTTVAAASNVSCDNTNDSTPCLSQLSQHCKSPL